MHTLTGGVPKCWFECNLPQHLPICIVLSLHVLSGICPALPSKWGLACRVSIALGSGTDVPTHVPPRHVFTMIINLVQWADTGNCLDESGNCMDEIV